MSEDKEKQKQAAIREQKIMLTNSFLDEMWQDFITNVAIYILKRMLAAMPGVTGTDFLRSFVAEWKGKMQDEIMIQIASIYSKQTSDMMLPQEDYREVALDSLNRIMNKIMESFPDHLKGKIIRVNPKEN